MPVLGMTMIDCMQAPFPPGTVHGSTPGQRTQALLSKSVIAIPIYLTLLTANVEAGASQNAAISGMTHQIVPRLLPGPIKVGQGQGQGGGVKEAGQLRGQAATIEGPVEPLSGGPRCVSMYRAGSLQGGADEKSGVLGADHSCVWSQRRYLSGVG